MNFGKALEELKAGKKVARKGWNGKGMYLFLGEQVQFSTNADLSELEEEGKSATFVKIHNSICMRTSDKSIVVGWLASQTDMLAEDWIVVE